MAPSPRALHRRESGSAILAALMILTVTLIAVSAALFEASHRFRTSHQSSRWSQAGQAAEAGAEIALMTAQKNSWTIDGWSGAPGAVGSPPVTKTITLSSGTSAMRPVSSRVSVDKVKMGGNTIWLQIRAKGVAELSGGARVGIDRRDVMFRKLSLRKDRDTGASVAAPQATRTVVILAEPLSAYPFSMAMLIEKSVNIGGNAVVDSFDSRDPKKSTNGLYDFGKRGLNADIGVNDTGLKSDFQDSFVGGDLAYSGLPIDRTRGVTGTISTPFAKTTGRVSAPEWTTFNATPTIISSSMTLTGGPQTLPARYKVSALDISNDMLVTMAAHAVNTQSYVEIWITGDFKAAGSSIIASDPNVHVTYFVDGNVSLTGKSIDNKSGIAAKSIINVVDPPEGTVRTVLISGQGTMTAAVNAPKADVTISGQGTFIGAVTGKSMNMGGNGFFHYDEALTAYVGKGASSDSYRVASWVEAVR